MKRFKLVAVLGASVASVIFVSAIGGAQPAPQRATQVPPMGMMGGGMNMGGMGGIGMGCMGGMGAMQMMQKDPKLMGRMMELQGEMTRLMSDAMTQRGKELQKGK